MKQVATSLVILLWLQFTQAIDISTVFHEPDDIFYVNLSAGEIRLKTKKDNISEAYVVIDSQFVKMELLHTQENFDYFAAEIGVVDTLTYHFILMDESDSLKFPSNGDLIASVPVFLTPSWAMGKTYYSIFTDGFYNGSHSNDPPQKLAWDEKPETWRSYGGDLKGILKKITYLDSLDPDIILLQPIFRASSNHKFNTNNYIMIDPAFGDTMDLKTLINELHERNKKVVLHVIVTHTGADFSLFTDIVGNGASSKYIDWYLIHSTPIATSPPTYECWRSDPRFPKLNLKNHEVQNYIIGLLEYWKHFGFDGFYIGADATIDRNFIKILRSHLKSKYPDLLLLGSCMPTPTLDGFDGGCNKTITELAIKYFIKRTISTSEFASSIQKVLFFNLPQHNCTNLLSLSDYTTRIHKIAKGGIANNLYAFTFTMCGSPVILYGDEIGMSEYVYLNAGSFRWNPEEQNRDFLSEIKNLIQIRKTHPQFSKKYYYPLYANDITRVYAYDRGGIIVILNSGEAQSFVRIPAWDGVYQDLVSGAKFTVDSQLLKLSIHANSYRILKREL